MAFSVAGRTRLEIEAEAAATHLLGKQISRAVSYILGKDIFGLSNLLTVHQELAFYRHDCMRFPMHNSHLKSDETLLHLACREGFTYAVELIIRECKADVNAQSAEPFYEQPLHLAAMSNTEVIVDLLLQHGAMSTALNRDKMNAFMCACCAGSLSTAQKILNLGIVRDYDAATREGKTAIYFASLKGLISIVRQLWERGVDLGCDFEQRSLLHAACLSNQTTVIQYLVKNGVPTTALDKFGKTPFEYLTCQTAIYSAHIAKLEFEAAGAMTGRKLRQINQSVDELNWFRSTVAFSEENTEERRIFAVDFGQETPTETTSRLAREKAAENFAKLCRKKDSSSCGTVYRDDRVPLFAHQYPPQIKAVSPQKRPSKAIPDHSKYHIL